jgi:hypothetical protein
MLGIVAHELQEFGDMLRFDLNRYMENYQRTPPVPKIGLSSSAMVIGVFSKVFFSSLLIPQEPHNLLDAVFRSGPERHEMDFR